VGLAALWAGCKEDVPAPTELALDGLTVRVWADPGRIEIRDESGEVLFDGLPGGEVAEGEAPLVAAAMRTAGSRWEFGFGSFKIVEREPGPWRGVRRFGNVRTEGTAIRFDLVAADGGAIGTGEVAGAGEGQATLTFLPADAAINRVSVGFACRPGEHFLGLGGQSFDVDHRGQSVPLWVQEDGLGKVETDSYEGGFWYMVGRRHSTHSPMPMFVSSRGYAMMLEGSHRSIFHLCSESDEAARVEAWEGAVRLRLFRGPTAADAIGRMTAHVGRPELPPAFAFFPWLDALFGSENVRRVASKLRDEGIPASVIWSEDWRGGNRGTDNYVLEEDWRVDRALYPDFEAVADDLHDLGFKWLVYNNTFLTRGSDVFDEAIREAYCIHTEAGEPYLFMGVTFVDTSLLDLTNPAAWIWARDIWAEGLRIGADGWMADYAEWLPVDIRLHDGADPYGYHNLYPVDFQRLTREVFDAQHAVDGVERLFFARSAWVGSQPLVSIFWAGDQQTDWTVGDGMPSVIPMGIGLGVTGFPFYGHDIGGYQSYDTEPTSRELWYRWVSLGALSPVMRTHHGRSLFANWNWESDADATAHFRRWAILHTRLFPYLYASAREAVDTGLPMMRPMALRWPDWDPGWTLTDQYLLGDRIVVAPVVEEGATRRTVRLPAGTFHPLEGGVPVTVPAGGGTVDVAAPLDACPAFVPAGSVLVLLPDGVDTGVREPVDPAVSALADVGDDREVWLYPGGSSDLVEATGLVYRWDAGTLSGSPPSAEWNGTPVTAAGGAFAVAGNGTLTLPGGATLTVSGGEADRELVIRVR
jgi:alpha-glucosidase (family GH31 glycosyl hydrolase)